MTVNLLKETKEALAEQGLTLNDVIWIGGNDFAISMSQFMELANQVYDAGFGGQEIANDLVVVGDKWWLERCEYDGSEWWAFKTIPRKPEETCEIMRLMGALPWSTLKEKNAPEED